MTLGRVKEVVFLQPDTGFYAIGNLMHSLSPGWLKAPRPSALGEIGLADLDARMAAAYATFEAAQNAKEGPPFYVAPDGYRKHTASITSFLCTDAARDVFVAHGDRLAAFECAHPDHAPADGALTNAQALNEARDFLNYVKGQGGRATHAF